jgi:hypothetical protein
LDVVFYDPPGGGVKVHRRATNYSTIVHEELGHGVHTTTESGTKKVFWWPKLRAIVAARRVSAAGGNSAS